jgi:hypothetical protein
MKKNNTELVDEYLKSLEGMKDAGTNPFFYTRLRSKMDKRRPQPEFNGRPVFAISILLVFLFVNLWMVDQQKHYKKENNTTQLQNFAQAYDFTVSDYY